MRTTPFEAARPLEKGFKNLSFETGVYALKFRDEEILYVGKAAAFRTRFQNGHHILSTLFLEGKQVEDIRIITVSITARYVDYLLTLEKGVIFALQPRYNSIIAPSEVAVMQQLQKNPQGYLSEVLKFLPDPIVEAIEDHADAYGLTDAQVLELAIAQFLDLNAVSFEEISALKGVGALKEENAILKARLRALGQSVEEEADN
ncbi:MAG TPA: GIY-YIG nuclease family protein [Allocoleopsis sp.]